MQKINTVKVPSSKITRIREAANLDMPLLIVVLILLALGIVMVLSASAPSALAEFNDSYRFVKTQGIAAILGLVAMFVFSRIDYHIFKKWYKLIYVISIAVLFLVLVPGIGMDINGAKRWIKIGIQVQPSEITKIGMILFFAGYYTDDRIDFTKFKWCCVVPLILMAIPIVILYFVQNHLSAGIVIGGISLIMIMISGCRLKYLVSLMGAGIGGLGFAFLLFKDKLTGSFRSDRIEAWLDPMKDPSGTSYQTVQSLYAIGSGGLFGVGLGESRQKYSYIPEAHNDFIFSIIAEELGFVGCVIVLLLFAIFAFRGARIAMMAKDKFGSMIAIGITSLIAIQAILNIAVVTNSIPNTGISLPFLSYGGSSLLILLSCVGIVLNISRKAKKI